MANGLFELENRRLRNQLQTCESRVRVSAEAVVALREQIIAHVVPTSSLEHVSELIRRADAILALLRGGEVTR